MHRFFIKGNKIQKLQVVGDFVIGSFLMGENTWVSNPKLTDFLADGWEEYDPTYVIHHKTYDELVEEYIRSHGYPTYGSELSVINNYAEDPTEYQADYDAYHACRNAAKEWALHILNPAEEEEEPATKE